MRIFKCDKTVVSFHPRAVAFLNGLTSNTFDQPRNAFLNIHGRIIAVFDQIKRSDEHVMVCLNNSYLDILQEHLLRYLLLGGVELQIEAYHVYFDLDSKASISEEDFFIAQQSGQLVISNEIKESTVTCDEFSLFRLKNNIPWHGVDFTNEFILNVHPTDYVSFSKGCYLGQEPVSKVYHRSKPTWSLKAVCEEDCTDDQKTKLTTKTFDPSTNKVMGFGFIKFSEDTQ